MRTRTCAYQGVRSDSFFGKFCVRSKWIIPYVPGAKLKKIPIFRILQVRTVCQQLNCFLQNPVIRKHKLKVQIEAILQIPYFLLSRW